MKQRVLVCGGRDYADEQQLHAVLNEAHELCPFTCLIHGAASGADTLAADWALIHGVPCSAYPANWDRHGKAAGPIRNQQMLEQGKPHMVIAFPGKSGTANMIQQAEAAGVTVVRIADVVR